MCILVILFLHGLQMIPGLLILFCGSLLNSSFLTDRRCFTKMYLLSNVLLSGVCLKISNAAS
jgi:hypothetical protein